jgi:hypothetical protein
VSISGSEGESLHLQNKRLPDARVSVSSVWSAPSCHVADELPCVTLICAHVKIDVGAVGGGVAAPTVSTRQYCPNRERTNCERELSQRRLCIHSKAVDLVRHVGDPLPRCTAVAGAKDGENGRLGVQSGCGENHAIRQLRDPWIEYGVVGI